MAIVKSKKLKLELSEKMQLESKKLELELLKIENISEKLEIYLKLQTQSTFEYQYGFMDCPAFVFVL